MHIKNRIIALALVAAILPLPAISAGEQPYRQDFLITAYYSPKPGQCCYVRGSYEADIELNGRGTNGASGVPVHPGMVAAPKAYPFGTRIDLPGLGVVTVEDRGGAITTLEDGTHRLDIWAGEGEEGLARALAFGLQRISGTVYPKGSRQPAESLALSAFTADWAELSPLLEGRERLMHVAVKQGDRSASVQLLQELLQANGFFGREPTGFFGPETQKSLAAFLKAFSLEEPSDALSPRTAAFLLAAENISKEQPIPKVQAGSPPARIADVQRLLRHLGYYRGRTHGKYDGNLRRAIVAYQRDQGVIASAGERGAGTVGPKTHDALARSLWKKKVARCAKEMVLLARIDDLVLEQNRLPTVFLGKGDKGEQVRLLQKLLAERGLLPAHRATGFYGDETEKAVIAFQLQAGVIKDEKDKGAGRVGPGTRMKLLTEIRSEMYRLVRSGGWEVL
ncbi:MAG: peptidoglycan-binding protein [Candidatus Peribacteraceae bacterium]|jgi:peptidoglycan hydrolase-like protein with peptidoglycan-binding domain/3D (Asp-Asp-Asp) domain-containing protein